MAFPGKAVGLLRSRLEPHLRSSSHLVQPYSFNMLQPHGFSVHISEPICKEHVKAISFVGGNAAGKHIYDRAGL